MSSTDKRVLTLDLKTVSVGDKLEVTFVNGSIITLEITLEATECDYARVLVLLPGIIDTLTEVEFLGVVITLEHVTVNWLDALEEDWISVGHYPILQGEFDFAEAILRVKHQIASIIHLPVSPTP